MFNRKPLRGSMIDARGAGVMDLAMGNGHLPAADVIDFARGYGTPAARALWMWRGGRDARRGGRYGFCEEGSSLGRCGRGE